MKARAVVIFAFVIATLGGLLAEQNSSVSSQALADFEWFSSLRYPDVSNAPLVRVISIWTWGQENKNTNQTYGFLLSTNQDSFTFVTLDLVQSTQQYSNKNPNQVWASNKVDMLSLKEMALNRIKAIEHPPEEVDHFARMGLGLKEQGEVFMIAWACWRQGLPGEAQKLYELASKMPDFIQRGSQRRDSQDKDLGPTKSFRLSLEMNLAYIETWRAIVAFGDPAVTRSELLERLRSILKKYPRNEYKERVSETVGKLEKMILEDKSHVAKSPQELKALPVEDRVRELIFMLRDQNGAQWSQPGSCDVFMNPDRSTNTPAHLLVAIGYPAVPQLIAALDDDRFSRSVGYHRDFYFSHHVLTIGDCASQILYQISGQRFYQRVTTSGYMSKDAKVSPVRKAAEEWWAQFQRKGEKQSLVEAVVKGDDNSYTQGCMLLDRYPADAPAALVKGIKASEGTWVRCRLIELLGKSGAAESVTSLEEEMKSGPHLESRVAAARYLSTRDKTNVAEVLIAEWKKFPARQKPDSDDGFAGLVNLMASLDVPIVYQVMEEGLSRHLVSRRLVVVEAVGEGGSVFDWQKAKQASPAAQKAREQLLVSALNDFEERVGMSGSRGNVSYSDPRICDMAAYCLATKWPQKYQFNLQGTYKQREKQRLACLNVWRAEQKLPLLPLPVESTVRLPANEANKVTSIIWVENGAALPEEFKRTVDSMKGQQLSVDKISELLIYYIKANGHGSIGLRLICRKDEDTTGVCVELRFLPGTNVKGRNNISVHERVLLANNTLESSSGSGSLDYYTSVKSWESMVKAGRKVIEAPPEMPFTISIYLRLAEDDADDKVSVRF